MNTLMRLFTIISLLGLCLAPGSGTAWAGQPVSVPLSSDEVLLEHATTWNSPPATTYSLAWGDVDNDGDLDLAVGNVCDLVCEPNQLYLNAGGILTLSTWTPSVAATRSLAWGDVDNDGDLDLAVGTGCMDIAPFTCYPNRVYLNENEMLQNSPAWAAPQNAYTKSLAWGDVDGDGDLDLAVGNGGKDGAMQSNQLYLNDGTGGLTLSAWAPDPGYTEIIAWGDLDGDGDLDLVVGNQHNPNQLYLNDGTGGLTLSAWAPDARHTTSLAWGDVDGDSDLDLSVGNNDQPNQLYLNDGSGSLTLSSWAPITSTTNSLAWGDVDGDGDLDLAVGNGCHDYDPNTCHASQAYLNVNGMLQNNPAWTADTAYTFYTNSVAWGDVDNDGDLDLAVGNGCYIYNCRTNQLYLNQTSLLAPNAWAPTSSTYNLAWGDVDSDGDLDLAVGNFNHPNQLYLNNGRGDLTLLSPSPFITTPQTNSLAWGDVDGDGDLDLAVGNWTGPNQLYLNDGRGNLSPSTWAPPSLLTTSVAWGDMDNDGDLDLAVGNSAIGAPNHVYPNVNGMLQITPTWTAESSYVTRIVAWGDVNGDGNLDLAVGNDFYKPVQLYLNVNGRLQTTPAWSVPGHKTMSLAWGDVDSDGDLDLAVGNQYYHNQLYLNVSGTLQATPSWEVDATYAHSLAWGDVDGDGDLDLAIGNGCLDSPPFTCYPSQLYLNMAGTLQTTPAWTFGGAFTRSVAWGDANGDGDLDLATGNVGAPSQVYLGGANRAGGPFYPAPSPAAIAIQPSSSSLVHTYNGSLVRALAPANGYAVSWIRENGVIPITYTLQDAGSYTSVAVNAQYSLNGGGQWYPAVPVSTTQTQNLATTLGSALRFDGVNDYVDIPIDVSETSYGLSLWFKTTCTDCGLFSVISGTLGGGDYDRDIYLNGSQLCAYVYASETICTSGANYANGQWHHMVHTFGSGVGQQLYADGVLVANGAKTSSDFTWQTNVNIGRSQGRANDYLNGIVDEVRLYDRLLASQEVALLANSGAPPATGLAGYWPLDEGTGGIANDQTGHGHHGVLMNGPRWVPGAPRRYVFEWDVLNSHFYGQSDNVVIRLLASADAHPRPGGLAGPYQHAALSATTFPLRVRGSQVRVMQDGSPVQGAMVYKITASQAYGGPFADLGGQPYLTTAEGYLAGSGKIFSGDRLVALLPVEAQIRDFSLLFDGVDDYVEVPYQSNLQPNNFTVEAWIKADTWETLHWQGTIVGTEDWVTGPRGYILRTGDNGRLSFTLACGSNWSEALSAPLMQTGVWYHVAATFDGTTLTALLNSVPVGTATCSQPVGLAAYPLNIGRAPYDTSRRFDGAIKEVRLWDVARTPAELQATMAGQLGGDEPGLVAYWPLDDGMGELAHDRTLHGYDGTLHGPAWQGTPLYTVYHTSAAPTEAGLNAFAVEQGGVQTLTVSAANPLTLFDLDVSLEWDARDDASYLETLQYDLQRVSEILYDWSNGQTALGQVTIYHDRQRWNEADLRIYVNNRLRPNANQGGITPYAITETITSTGATITYSPGQVRMGAVWNRYGDPGGNLGDNWPRTLAHELGHYLFYLDDNYLGLSGGLLVSISGCPGVMSDPYSQAPGYDEFHPTAGWLPECADTLSNQTTGRADWATINAFYPALITPTVSITQTNQGPVTLPLAVTQVSFVAPAYASETLVDPTFYLAEPSGARYLPGLGARAYLFQTVGGVDRLVDLGSPVFDHVLARGARPGDRICVFDTSAARLGCETISANDNKLAIQAPDWGWQPDIVITPITSQTISVTVVAPPTLTLQARLFLGSGAPTDPITLTGSGTSYSEVFNTTAPAMAGYVQVWVVDDQPCTADAVCREAVSVYSLGGSPGPHGAGSGSGSNAPAISADGQVILYGRLDFSADQFYTLQEVNVFPSPLAWATPIGPAYRLTASVGAPPLGQASLSIAYLAADVPPGEEAWIRIYFWDGARWQILPTTLDAIQNTAAALVQGAGVYALMSSYQIRLMPGWNMFAYPVLATRAVTESLASLAGNYGQVYFYDPDDALDHWKLYDPGVLGWVNDLEALSFGHGYWISVTQNITTSAGITLYLKGAALGEQVLLPEAFNAPPATFYGVVVGSPGQAITAWIGSTVCGQGLTRQVAGQVVYVVDVASAWQVPGCGSLGRVVSFRLGNVALPTQGAWTDARPLRLDFFDLFQQFLPLILRR
jgi:hypothetical protein